MNSELCTSLALVNERFSRLPLQARESLDLSWNRMDRLLDRVLIEGSRADAKAALREWQSYYLRLFEEIGA